MFDFDTLEQQEIRTSVRKFARSVIPKFQKSEYFNTLPKELWRSLAELGISGLAVSSRFGGLGGCPITASIIMEELASVDLGPAIFTSVHAMVCGLIERHADEAVKMELLPQLSSGSLLAAFALTEPGAGSDAAAITTTARTSEGGYILNGEKCYISGAGFADLYLVFARTTTATPEQRGGGISAFIVGGNSPGIAVSAPDHKMGCELSPIASLTFNNVFVPNSRLLGTLNNGYQVALSGLAGGRVNIAACANGLSKAALDCAITHLKSRSQFGAPLAQLQGLQFMLADLKVLLEASQLLTWQAASVLKGALPYSNARACPSYAKCFATDSAMRITTDAVQLLGGAGYLTDYRVERLMREAKMLQIVEGTNQIQRIIIAQELLDGFTL